ncbi:MAG: sulfatase [Bryobacteraceae bacterium]|nr:sulfatase [Bryobacteraceae bacterium]
MRPTRPLGVFLTFLLIAVLLSCRSAERREEAEETPAPSFRPYRFDDNLETAATVSAPEIRTSARVADPIIWKDFLTEKDANWKLLRGFMGLRDGDLILKGGGASPVIQSPKDPEIDWSLFDTVVIRMMAEGGSELKIKIGDVELTQKLGPPHEYRVYRFDVDIQAPRGTRPLAIMPTDSPAHLAAIDYIELAPRRTSFPTAAGKQVIGKGEEYRNAIYVHSPSTLTFEVPVPEHGRLKFGIGVAQKNQPVTFRVLAGPSGKPVFKEKVGDASRWADADVDLSAFAGESTTIVFETTADSNGAVGFWTNPLLTTAAPKNRPNVLIYLVCSLRTDHTSLYGYERDTTPFMKSLGAAGVVFEDAQAQAPWTKASVPSLMTSLYAYATNIRHDTDTIPRAAVPLAEVFRKEGYSTASIVTNPFVGRASGLHRGYDYMVEYPVVHHERKDDVDRGTDSAALNKVALPWLQRHHHEPFFLYLHVTDPHAPYRPPKEFERKFADPAETKQFDEAYRGMWDPRQYGGGTTVSPEMVKRKGVDPKRFIQQAKDRYDGEVAFMDHSLEQLAGKLKDLGALDDTLIIVLADHGEEFFDHGFTAHGHSLYRELIHAVLMMWNPRLLPAPRRVTETVQLIDVYPTILDLLRIAPPGLIQGQSLAPLLAGKPFARKAPVVSTRFAHPNAKPGGTVPENRTGGFAIFQDQWKLIYRDQARRAGLPEVELYDRRADPKETSNVAAANPEVVTKLRNELDAWIAAQEEVKKMVGPGGKSKLDPQSLERLRTLGYIGGSAPKP